MSSHLYTTGKSVTVTDMSLYIMLIYLTVLKLLCLNFRNL